VSLAVSVMLDKLLPTNGKQVFPSAVPFRFILPPRIAKATPFVSPVPKPDFSAPCNHRASADRTLAGKIGLSFLALSTNESEFHCLDLACNRLTSTFDTASLIERRDTGAR